ncbi:MAG: inositol 2-dehydrogenase [Caldilineaceae bacterium]|nr:inositol 2-dehydrogenase [Caldilineaceae bacterium]
MPTNPTLNLGLIGAGRIGRVHAENIALRIPNARTLIVADVDEAAAQRCADEFRVNFAVKDYRMVLDSPAIDAVLICSATHTHAHLIQEAARAGKHIFCEKPIDHNLTVVDAALAAVDAAGVKLQIGFNRRFDANYARVRRAIAEGEIGAPQLMHIISRDPAPPPAEYIAVSGGLFLDMMIHDFDMARFLLGSEVTRVYAAAANLVDPAIGEAGDVDTALVTLTFANGALAVIDNSRRAVYGYDQRVEVLGSAGAVRTENNYPNTMLLLGPERIARDLPLHFFMERYQESYRAELQAFVDAVLNHAPVPVTGADGRAPIVLAEAAARSVREGRVVEIDD